MKSLWVVRTPDYSSRTVCHSIIFDDANNMFYCQLALPLSIQPIKLGFKQWLQSPRVYESYIGTKTIIFFTQSLLYNMTAKFLYLSLKMISFLIFIKIETYFDTSLLYIITNTREYIQIYTNIKNSQSCGI